MKISDDKSWLFISVRKCATNTMYRSLPGKRIGTGFHGRPQPGERLADKHFTIVRNPYDRAVSIYASTVLRPKDHYGAKAMCDGTFEDFCRRCLITSNQRWGREPWLFRNQSSWLDGLVIDHYLRFENLQDDVESLGLGIELAHENVSEHAPWESYINDITLPLLNEWAGHDFEKYGYDRIQ